MDDEKTGDDQALEGNRRPSLRDVPQLHPPAETGGLPFCGSCFTSRARRSAPRNDRSLAIATATRRVRSAMDRPLCGQAENNTSTVDPPTKC